jgi:undecaprenyl-diphosphatase
MLAAVLVLVATAVLLTLIARKVAAHETRSTDERVRRAMQAHRARALDVAAKPITLLSIPLVIVIATAALVWWLHHSGRNNAALAIGVTLIVAAAVGQAFTSFFPQPAPPESTGETKDGKKPPATFPSGHTAGVTAEALAIAFVLAREKIASPAVIALLLAWPIIVGVSRLYRDRHWFSDIVAGWVAGIGVASMSVLVYQARLL